MVKTRKNNERNAVSKEKKSRSKINTIVTNIKKGKFFFLWLISWFEYNQTFSDDFVQAESSITSRNSTQTEDQPAHLASYCKNLLFTKISIIKINNFWSTAAKYDSDESLNLCHEEVKVIPNKQVSMGNKLIILKETINRIFTLVLRLYW